MSIERHSIHTGNFGVHPCFDICRGDSSWIPVSQCGMRDTCQSRQCTCWSNQDSSSMYRRYSRVSVRVSAVFRQRARGSGERGVPDGNLELADGRSLLAAWFGLKDCSGPRVWTDITWYNIVKLLAPVGMENLKGACDSASPDRGRFMQPILGKNEMGKSSSQATCQQVSIDQPRIWMYRLDLVPMHGILCVNPADPFQFHGLRRQHQEQVGCLLIVSSYTWPKGFKMSQMGMRRSTTRTKELVMCSFMMSLDLSTSPYFQVFSGLTLKRSNHCEVQMFCAPSHRPRQEPEGLTHGVVERCLRIRLMFLPSSTRWASISLQEW